MNQGGVSGAKLAQSLKDPVKVKGLGFGELMHRTLLRG